ncbi:hypothetical protein GCM10023177_01900 [Streptomyces violaceoruber]|nr:hypothetical protein JCM4020_02160 [Streptomyces coelicolor]
MDHSARAGDIGQASTVRADDQAAVLLARTDIDSAVVLEPQKDIGCRIKEAAITDVRPGNLADAVVEGDQVGRDETVPGERASRGLVGAVGPPYLVDARGKAVPALELVCHGLQGLRDPAGPRGQPGGGKRTVTHEVGSWHGPRTFPGRPVALRRQLRTTS